MNSIVEDNTATCSRTKYKGWMECRLMQCCQKIGSGITPKGGDSVYVERPDAAFAVRAEADARLWQGRADGGWRMADAGRVESYYAWGGTFIPKVICFLARAIDRREFRAPFVYNIHYGDLHARYPGPLLDFERERRVPVLKAEVARSESLDYLREGDLVMADVSEDFQGVGACIELVNLKKRKVTAGLHTFALRDTSGKTAQGFRGYLFKEHGLAKELRRIATGVSVYGLSKTNLSKVLLALPPLEEQKAIVEVLSAADREIDALRRKLGVWKVQKQYLLNHLVDGTIRLPEFVELETEVAG